MKFYIQKYKENLKQVLGFFIGVLVCFAWMQFSAHSKHLAKHQGLSLSKIENQIRPEVNRLAAKYDVEMFLVRKSDHVLLRLLDKDIFPINSADLSEKGKELMDELGALLAYHEGDFIISGHYDSVNPFGEGDKEVNQMLISTNRSSQLAAYLTKSGVAVERLGIKGFGSTVPLFKDRDQVGQYLAQEGNMNRRLEIALKIGEETL